MAPYPSPTLRTARQRQTRRVRHGSRGFSLIEALVTLVVLSIGMLALANLQLQTLLDSRTASMRNFAALMAYNLADQVRSNETAVTNGTFKNIKNTPEPNCYAAAGCDPTQMATTAYATWLEDIRAAMPGGDGIVCVDSSPDDGESFDKPECDGAANAPYVIKIWWREDKQVPQHYSTALIP